jgi:LysM repeat protein
MKKWIGLSFVVMGLVSLLLALQTPSLAAPLAQLTVFPTPTPGPDGRIVYIAQEGDTLWRISAITGIPIDTIRDLNQMAPDDNTVVPGREYLLGYAGPVEATPTMGPTLTAGPQVPTQTASPGWGILCILLYEDKNGDAMRQEEEPSLPGGAVSVGNRLGTVSLSAETPPGGISSEPNPTPQQLGYTCFEELPEGQYTANAAVPDNYNATTTLNKIVQLGAGQTTLVAFGAQPNAVAQAESALIPQTPGRSPLLGIVGALFLLGGAGLGVYAALLRRSSRFKRQLGE